MTDAPDPLAPVDGALFGKPDARSGPVEFYIEQRGGGFVFNVSLDLAALQQMLGGELMVAEIDVSAALAAGDRCANEWRRLCRDARKKREGKKP